jgi:hypothetical protein
MASPRDILAEIAETFGLDIIYAFGSRGEEAVEALEEKTPESGDGLSPSDLDIGVRPVPGHRLSVRDKARLACALENPFDVNRVDLVVLSEYDPFLAANIVRGERIFEQDSYRADEYDLYVLRRAGDLEPLERERIALIMGEAE